MMSIDQYQDQKTNNGATENGNSHDTAADGGFDYDYEYETGVDSRN